MATLLAEQLQPEATELLTPDPSPFQNLPGPGGDSFEAHVARETQFAEIIAFNGLEQTLLDRRDPDMGGILPYVTPEGILDTFTGTQMDGENHRRLTPLIQEAWYYPDTRNELLAGVDEMALRSSESVIAAAERNGGGVFYDVAVLGSGPHGTAAAMQVREKYPNARILMVDQAGLGGQWRGYGPNAAFWMNSRVRRADRSLPPIPRTPGNINPLGDYATLELSDVVRGNYATSAEMGNVTAINGAIASNDFLFGYQCADIEDNGTDASMAMFGGDGKFIRVSAALIVDATGIQQESTLSDVRDYEDASWYFNTAGIYRHFGNYERKMNHSPLAQFRDKDIVVVGGGDSVLTALEALLGNLPEESYGPGGVGRNKPRSITWVGAPGETAEEIDKCLRSRYKNGIIQALPKSIGDLGAIIRPVPLRGRALNETGGLPELILENGFRISGDYIFDGTNRKRSFYGPRIDDYRPNGFGQSAVVKVGPGANLTLPDQTLEVISRLGIGENTVALWALMGLTNTSVLNAAQANLRIGRRRRR